uniref:Uncharacterized protein n=1 Tax=Xiphophorus couchianus TaxID=32473 RepID=A0A3B5KYR9_9TELE
MRLLEIGFDYHWNTNSGPDLFPKGFSRSEKQITWSRQMAADSEWTGLSKTATCHYIHSLVLVLQTQLSHLVVKPRFSRLRQNTSQFSSSNTHI